jgi:hypothetical protein
MARRPQSGAEVAKELMDKMRHKNGGAAKPPDDADELQQQKRDEASAPHVEQGEGTQAAPIAEGPTLEDRLDAAQEDAPSGVALFQTSHPLKKAAAAPAAPVADVQTPKRARMSGHELKQMQRQQRREKRLKEHGY